METLKDKKIAKLEELVSDLASLINSEDAIAIGLKDRLSEITALSEQPDTAPTVRDELIKFYEWKCKNNLYPGHYCETHESIVDKYLSSTANQENKPK